MPVHNALPETRDRAMKLVADGKPVAAVRLVRKATGADLLSAKVYVDGLKVEFLAGRVPAEVEARARALVAEGEPREAVKHVVRTAGLGLKDGKQYVDALRDGQLPGAAAAGPLSERVRAFVTSGDRPSAVALVSAETGMTPEEADRFVDALD
ncbi:hypothetical protein [Actinomadura litoris]|uniref:hypothetical protein n=1 Tax=Actinomadura litoris TaxID=2678616 RepID=UPI001FA6D400|nr:hypothetical protein [Actinomadura litoris]